MFLKWIEENQSSSLVPKNTQIESETVKQEVQIVNKGEVVVEEGNVNIVTDQIPDDPKVSNSDKIEAVESLSIDVSQNKQEDELFKDTISISSEEPEEFLDLENDFEPELLKIEEEAGNLEENNENYDRRNSSVFEEAINDEDIRTPSVVEDFQTEIYTKEFTDPSIPVESNIDSNESLKPTSISESISTQNESLVSEMLPKMPKSTEDQKEASNVELKIVEDHECELITNMNPFTISESVPTQNESVKQTEDQKQASQVELKIVEDTDNVLSVKEMGLKPDEDVLVEAKIILTDSKLRIDTSTSNLSSSNNSLCTSEGSSSNVEERPQSRPSFRSKGKAPPIPPEKHVEIIPPILPIKPIAITKEIPKPTSPIPEPRTKDKEKRKSKLMSSITGIFKHDQPHHKEVQPNNSLHPSHVEEDNVTVTLKETQI